MAALSPGQESRGGAGPSMMTAILKLPGSLLSRLDPPFPGLTDTDDQESLDHCRCAIPSPNFLVTANSGQCRDPDTSRQRVDETVTLVLVQNPHF